MGADEHLRDSAMRHDLTLLTDQDIYLFKQGNHFNLYDKLGSHLINADGVEGTYFAVWAPNAERVSVIGDFNQWDKESHPLKVREDGSGIWEGFIPGISQGLSTSITSSPDTTITGWTKVIPLPFAGNVLPKRLPSYGIWVMNGGMVNG